MPADADRELLARIGRRNAWLNVLDGIGWQIAIACFSIAAILPAYVARLGGGRLASAAVVAVWVVGTRFPQALSSWWSDRHAETRPALLRIAAGQRVALSLIALTALVASPGVPALAVFFVLDLAWALLTGLTFPIWIEFIARALSPEFAGRALGLRGLVGSIASVLASLAAAALLGRLPFPANYAAVFGLGALALTFGFVPLAAISEVPRPVPARGESFAEHVRSCLAWIRSTPRRRRLALCLALSSGMFAPLGLFFPHAIAAFGDALSAAERDRLAGLYAFAQTAALAGLAWPFGRAVDRFGSRRVAQAGMLCGAVAPLLALALDRALGYALVYVAVGATGASVATGFIKLYMEESQGEGRTRALVALEACEGAALVVATLGAGAVASRFGDTPVFLGSAALCLVAAAALHGVGAPEATHPGTTGG